MNNAGRNVSSTTVDDHDHQGFSHNDEEVLLPGKSMSITVTTVRARASRKSRVVLAVGVLLASIGLFLRRIVWFMLNENTNENKNDITDAEPIAVVSFLFILVGFLLAIGGLIGYCCERRNRRQQQIMSDNLVNVVSGQLNQAFSVPPQPRNVNTGHSPFNQPPPPYPSKEDLPPQKQ